MGCGMEIERKFLVRMPDTGMLANLPGCVKWHIIQTYLFDGEDGSTRRVRTIETDGKTSYIRTFKHRISALSHREDEIEITKDEYDELLKTVNPDLTPISKYRYRIPYMGQLLEIDVYSFWDDRATLEIELKCEEQQVILPEWLDIIRDVTSEPAYKNRCLAQAVPMEEI